MDKKQQIIKVLDILSKFYKQERKIKKPIQVEQWMIQVAQFLAEQYEKKKKEQRDYIKNEIQRALGDRCPKDVKIIITDEDRERLKNKEYKEVLNEFV